MFSVLFWGTGRNAFDWVIYNRKIFNNITEKKFIDRKQILNQKNNFLGFPIISPEDIYKEKYDYICILSSFESQIVKDAIEIYKIPFEKIVSKYELEDIIVQNILMYKGYNLMKDRTHIFNGVENYIAINYFFSYIAKDDLPVRGTLKRYYLYKILREKYYDFAISYANTLKEKLGGEKREKNKIIWVCWFQGTYDMPPVVKACFEQMKKQMPEMKIILITENNYTLYVDFPENIIKKYNRGYITKTHFSDLLRLELLIKYGGIWIDATVFLTKKIPEFVQNASLFVFVLASDGEPLVDSRIAASWFIKSEPKNKILLLTRELLYKYHNENDYIEDYFIFHCFFRISTEIYSHEWKNLNNIQINGYLCKVLFEKFDTNKWNFIKEITFCQKLTYKLTIPESIKNTFYEKLIQGKLSED